jgi:hypothetical protein
MAELLGIGQEGISRLEKRSNLLISTPRSYVARIGGDLELIVRFPGPGCAPAGPDPSPAPTYPEETCWPKVTDRVDPTETPTIK